MDLLLKLRQLQFPKDFRIYPDELLNDLNEELKKLNISLNDFINSQVNSDKGNTKETDKLLVDLSTGLWRLKNKMINTNTKQPLDEMNRAYRHLDSIWTVLEQYGIEIIDYNGETFSSGTSIKVLAYEPTVGLDKETITETVKPSIYKNKSCIQMGEVIVGTPLK